MMCEAQMTMKYDARSANDSLANDTDQDSIRNRFVFEPIKYSPKMVFL